MSELDSPERAGELRALIQGKPALRRFYERVYARFAERLADCPREGTVLELGSGAGFIKEMMPGVVTSDVLPYPGVDQVVDASAMPFPDGSLRAVFMLNVFHHLPDAEAFLREADRCLALGGRVVIMDQHPGWISAPVFRHLHHEPFDPRATEWTFASTGPLSGANGALAWIVFRRDRERFERLFPRLKLRGYRPAFPLSYWLAGGLKKWSLIPGFLAGLPAVLDAALLQISPQFGSFVEIELMKEAR